MREIIAFVLGGAIPLFFWNLEHSTRATCEEMLADLEFYTEDGLSVEVARAEEAQ